MDFPFKAALTHPVCAVVRSCLKELLDTQSQYEAAIKTDSKDETISWRICDRQDINRFVRVCRNISSFFSVNVFYIMSWIMEADDNNKTPENVNSDYL